MYDIDTTYGIGSVPIQPCFDCGGETSAINDSTRICEICGCRPYNFLAPLGRKVCWLLEPGYDIDGQLERYRKIACEQALDHCEIYAPEDLASIMTTIAKGA